MAVMAALAGFNGGWSVEAMRASMAASIKTVLASELVA
jgi:hypothetical protein